MCNLQQKNILKPLWYYRLTFAALQEVQFVPNFFFFYLLFLFFFFKFCIFYFCIFTLSHWHLSLELSSVATEALSWISYFIFFWLWRLLVKVDKKKTQQKDIFAEMHTTRIIWNFKMCFFTFFFKIIISVSCLSWFVLLLVTHHLSWLNNDDNTSCHVLSFFAFFLAYVFALYSTKTDIDATKRRI